MHIFHSFSSLEISCLFAVQIFHIFLSSKFLTCLQCIFSYFSINYYVQFFGISVPSHQFSVSAIQV